MGLRRRGVDVVRPPASSEVPAPSAPALRSTRGIGLEPRGAMRALGALISALVSACAGTPAAPEPPAPPPMEVRFAMAGDRAEVELFIPAEALPAGTSTVSLRFRRRYHPDDFEARYVERLDG